MDQKYVLRSIETFGKHVLPQFDKDPVHSTTRQREARWQAQGGVSGSGNGLGGGVSSRSPMTPERSRDSAKSDERPRLRQGADRRPVGRRRRAAPTRSPTRRPRRPAGYAPECSVEQVQRGGARRARRRSSAGRGRA